MTLTETPSSDDDGDEEPELPPEQQERLKRQIDRIYKDLGPRFDFKFPQIDIGTSAFARIAADAAKFSRFALPEGLLKSIASASLFAEQNARLMDQFKPIFDAQSVWQRSLPVINSDILKLTGFGQSHLSAIAAQLAKSADFGLTDRLAQITKLYADQQANWLKAIAPALATLRGSFFPSNLQDIKGLGLEDIEQVVMLDGIALYEVPRADQER